MLIQIRSIFTAKTIIAFHLRFIESKLFVYENEHYKTIVKNVLASKLFKVNNMQVIIIWIFLSTELIESTVYLYQATKDPYLLEIGIDILESIEHSTRTKCGYATVSSCVTAV